MDEAGRTFPIDCRTRDNLTRSSQRLVTALSQATLRFGVAHGDLHSSTSCSGMAARR
jgi:hypothetical protein